MLRRVWLGLVLSGLCAGSAAAEAPAVVVSVKPVHSLVAAVMEGVGEPRLLIPGAGSPHTYALKPADARAISAARLVVWVGPALEGFMEKPIRALGSQARVITLTRDAGLNLLPSREGGVWEADDDHGHDHGSGASAGVEHEELAMDAHVWLAPDNAVRIVRHVAGVLAEMDPTHADRYRENAARTAADIGALDRELAARLAPLTGRPYIVFHDAYQYLERHYHLAAAGSITVSPERRPGAKRLYEIRAKIIDAKAVCVFAEPQFEPSLVRTVTEGTPARVGQLDPLGTDSPAGPGAYPALMRALAKDLGDCLGFAG